MDNKIEVRTLPFPFNETKTTSVNSFTQADFTLTPRQTLTTSFHAAPQNIRYANLDFFNPQPVTPNGDTQSYAGIGTHRLAIGEGLLQSTISWSNRNTTIFPQGPLGMAVQPTGNSGNYFASQGENPVALSGMSCGHSNQSQALVFTRFKSDLQSPTRQTTGN